MKIRVVSLCCTALLFASLAIAENGVPLPVVEPKDAGMSAAKLTELDATMRGFVDRGELSGVVTAVARDGKLVYLEHYGKADVEAGTPMQKDSIFRIYSMTKPIAGVALMTLFEEGKWALDDPVHKFIPAWKGMKVAKADGPDGMPVTEEATHPMTMRELMSHTGGLTYGFFSRSQTDTLYVQRQVLNRDSTLAEMVDKLAEIPLRHQPGSAWHYSVSVDVQGYIAEVLTGKPFDQVLRERVFEPLGMTDTAFWVPEEKESRFTKLYVQGSGGKLEQQPYGEYLSKPKFLSGGGGLVSTMSDYLRFAQMLANGGEFNGVRILKPETVRLMHTNQLPKGVANINPLIGNPGNTFGLDFAIVENPTAPADHPLAKGEFWWYGIGGTWFGVNPTQKLVVVGMIQSMGGAAGRKARFESKRLAYEAILEPGSP